MLRWSLLLTCCAVICSGAEPASENLLPAGNFSAGIAPGKTLPSGWEVSPYALRSHVSLEQGEKGTFLKIASPDIKLTLIDSLNKRLVFLNEVCSQLGIDAELIHSRAEDGARDEKLRESFDFVASRAVARMNVLSEYCLPYVKVGGAFLAMKGALAGEEMEEAKRAVALLGGTIERVYEYPIQDAVHKAVVIRKIKSTPLKYPRAFAKIKKTPL